MFLRSPDLPPIVLIHGAFYGPWCYDVFRQPFEAAGHKVIAPALRHHRPGWPAIKPDAALGTTSVLDYVTDLEAEIAKLDSLPVLVGHSMGGLIAQILAERGFARGAILIAPSAPWGLLPSTALELAAAQTLLFEPRFWEKALPPTPEVITEFALNRMPKGDHDRFIARFVPESGRATFEIFHWGLDTRQATRVRTRDVACPVLCVSGEYDRINSAATVRRIASRFTHTSYKEYRDRGHMLIEEPGWEDVATDCLHWIEATFAVA